MRSLRYLYLEGTKITAEGLRHLHGLSKLELLSIPPEAATPETTAALRKAIPGLRGIHAPSP